MFLSLGPILGNEVGGAGIRRSQADVEGATGPHAGLLARGHENFFLISISVILSNFHDTINLVAYYISYMR